MLHFSFGARLDAHIHYLLWSIYPPVVPPPLLLAAQLTLSLSGRRASPTAGCHTPAPSNHETPPFRRTTEHA